MEERQSFEKTRNTEASILKKNTDPKLNRELRPLGFGARQFAEQKRFRLGLAFVPPSQVSQMEVEMGPQEVSGLEAMGFL